MPRPNASPAFPAARLVVRASRISGRGAFATAPIAPRRKLGELAGERISVRAARRRAKRLASIAIVEISERHAIDATDSAAALRFVNHGCAPNCYLRIAYGRVEFYSLRPIAAGEELTCDYGSTHHNGTLACRCGSDACRGWL